MNRKNLIFLMIFIVTFYLKGSDAITIESLQPYENLISEKLKSLKIEDIVNWSTQGIYRKKSIIMSVSMGKPKLSAREKSKLERKGKVAFKVYGAVYEKEEGKKNKAYYSSSASVTIFSLGEKPKLFKKTRVSLKKFCPT